MTFGTAGVPELPHLEPLPGLPLMATLGHLCPAGVMSMPVGVAMLAPSSIASMLLGMAGACSWNDWSCRVHLNGWGRRTHQDGRSHWYTNVAGNAVHIGMARVTRYAGWGSHAGAVRQHGLACIMSTPFMAA